MRASGSRRSSASRRGRLHQIAGANRAPRLSVGVRARSARRARPARPHPFPGLPARIWPEGGGMEGTPTPSRPRREVCSWSTIFSPPGGTGPRGGPSSSSSGWAGRYRRAWAPSSSDRARAWRQKETRGDGDGRSPRSASLRGLRAGDALWCTPVARSEDGVFRQDRPRRSPSAAFRSGHEGSGARLGAWAFGVVGPGLGVVQNQHRFRGASSSARCGRGPPWRRAWG